MHSKAACLAFGLRYTLSAPFGTTTAQTVTDTLNIGQAMQPIPLPQGRISSCTATIITDDTQELVISGSSFTHALTKHIMN